MGSDMARQSLRAKEERILSKESAWRRKSVKNSDEENILKYLEISANTPWLFSLTDKFILSSLHVFIIFVDIVRPRCPL